MKLMINGAVTLGTEDGANVEIHRAVGDDNIIIFGMRTPEVEQRKPHYNPRWYYENNADIRRAIDFMYEGFGGRNYSEIANSLLTKDPYMVLADYADYARAQEESGRLYLDQDAWAKKAMLNTAGSGIFASDRSIRDYANNIWHVPTRSFE